MSISEEAAKLQPTLVTRRRHERLTTKGRVRGEVADAADSSLIGREFKGEIVEISPCGLRIETPLDLDAGTLDMWVELDGFDQRIVLSTEIRWVECVDDDLYHLGIEIITNPLSDLDSWVDFQRQQWLRYKAGEETL